MDDNFHFEIISKVPHAVLSTNRNGWTLELNTVKWGSNAPKFDIRAWSPDHEKMGKGVTLTNEELTKLGEAIVNLKSENQ